MSPVSTRPPTDAGESTSDGPRDLRGISVLLVEDDPEDRRLFSQQIEAGGLHPDVLSVETVAEAVEHLDDAAEVDVVVLDLGLPDSKGLDTLDAVTGIGTPVPVIVLTGCGNDPELAVAALRRGAHDYLVKGETSAGELARAIRYAIERHQMQRDASAQLLHQAALHQLELTGGATADLQGLARAAVSAVQVGLDVEWVSLRFAGESLPGVTAATVVGDLLAPGEIDVEGDVITTVDLRGDAGSVGRIDVPTPGDGGLTTGQRRFLTSAAAAIARRVDRLVATLELKARTQQLDSEQRAAEQLHREHELRDGFLRALSHELRTPLASIVGFVETLRVHGADLDPSQTSTMLERVESNAQRLWLLLEDLLDVGRLTAGVRSTAQRTEHDLSELVTGVVELLPTTEHVLDLHLERTPTHVDRSKVERIIHNLVGNAIRHTPPATTISVTTRRRANAAVLVVDDDGPGIPAREWDSVFEPFVQGSRAASSASPGTGVGLALVRRFVELHDGTVDLDVGPSGGARFTVVLPGGV